MCAARNKIRRALILCCTTVLCCITVPPEVHVQMERLVFFFFTVVDEFCASFFVMCMIYEQVEFEKVISIDATGTEFHLQLQRKKDITENIYKFSPLARHCLKGIGYTTSRTEHGRKGTAGKFKCCHMYVLQGTR